MGKNIVFSCLCLVASAGAFSQFPSTFTGRASSVCSRAELTTELSCPPSRSDLRDLRRGGNMSMPPFLKKLGLRKPNKPVLGGDKKEETEEATPAPVAAVEVEETTDSPPVQPPVEAKLDEEGALSKEKEELTETQKLMKQVKESGTAGIISYALWELGFWTISIPVCVFGYREVAGHWPDFSNKEDLEKLGAEAFAFVNFARFAVPLRIGLALSTTPWIQKNIVDKFMKQDETSAAEEGASEA